MGFEWRFEPARQGLRGAKFTSVIFGLLDIGILTFAYFFYSLFFFQLDLLHYAILILMLIHFWTFIAVSLLYTTGHGPTFEKFVGVLVIGSFSADLLAVGIKVLSSLCLWINCSWQSPVSGVVFTTTTFVFAAALCLISLAEVVNTLVFQNLAVQHRIDIESELLLKLKSWALVLSLRKTHRKVQTAKRAIRVLSGSLAVFTVLGMIVFFTQLFILQNGITFFYKIKFIVLLVAMFPHFFLWIVAYSLTGSRHAYPPDGMSDLIEIGFVQALYWIVTLILIGAVVFSSVNQAMFVSPGVGYVQSTHDFLFYALLILASISLLLTMITSFTIMYMQNRLQRRTLKERNETKEDLIRSWELRKDRGPEEVVVESGQTSLVQRK